MFADCVVVYSEVTIVYTYVILSFYVTSEKKRRKKTILVRNPFLRHLMVTSNDKLMRSCWREGNERVDDLTKIMTNSK